MTRPVLTPLDGVGIIDTAELVDAAVTNAKLATDAVTQAKVANAAIGTAELVDAGVTTVKILDAAVTAAKIADANVTFAKLNADVFGQPWQFLPLASGWGNYSTFAAMAYKRLGNIGFLAGAAFRSGGSAQFGTLPVGYRPGNEFHIAAVSGAGLAVVDLIGNGILTAGISIGDYVSFSVTYQMP